MTHFALRPPEESTLLTMRNGCGCGCSPGDSACAHLPAEFVRVRYYYGQRLGVMELNDEAEYHAGKHAFHNARLHGIGVVCGLIADRYASPPGGATTVLRVHRGAALDSCGREVIVGVDQCIDVAAWFAGNRTRPVLAGWTANTTQRLTLAVRYRECPSDPTLAPRDPCGCDSSGCEMGRIREGFELALLTSKEARCAHWVFPKPARLASAIAAGGPAAKLEAAIAGLVGAECPDPALDTWLCLATVEVKLDGNGVPSDIGAIDNAPPSRATLLATSALQSILLRLALAAGDSGAGLSGPSFTDLQFTIDPVDATSGVLLAGLSLLTSGTPATATPIAAGTFNASYVGLSRFDAGTWTDLTGSIAASLDPAPGIALKINGAIKLDTVFRVTVDQPLAEPIADATGRPLQPLRFARQFRLVKDAAGNVQLVPST